MDLSTKTVLTEKEASALFSISTSYLQKRRIKSGGPLYYKVGSRIYYKRTDLEAFFTGTPHTSTAEYPTWYKTNAAKEVMKEQAL